MIGFSTEYLGLKLKGPIVVSLYRGNYIKTPSSNSMRQTVAAF